MRRSTIKEGSVWINRVEHLMEQTYGLDRSDWIDSLSPSDHMFFTPMEWVYWFAGKHELEPI